MSSVSLHQSMLHTTARDCSYATFSSYFILLSKEHCKIKEHYKINVVTNLLLFIKHNTMQQTKHDKTTVTKTMLNICCKLPIHKM